VRLNTVEEERKDKRRQDLLRGTRDTVAADSAHQNEALVLQIRQLENELMRIREHQESGRGSEWEQKLGAAKEAHNREIERREKEFNAKIQEMDNLNKALRSSIQQMQQLHRKG
jgi:hypothetical protein